MGAMNFSTSSHIPVESSTWSTTVVGWTWSCGSWVSLSQTGTSRMFSPMLPTLHWCVDPANCQVNAPLATTTCIASCRQRSGNLRFGSGWKVAAKFEPCGVMIKYACGSSMVTFPISAGCEINCHSGCSAAIEPIEMTGSSPGEWIFDAHDPRRREPAQLQALGRHGAMHAGR